MIDVYLRRLHDGLMNINNCWWGGGGGGGRGGRGVRRAERVRGQEVKDRV